MSKTILTIGLMFVLIALFTFDGVAQEKEAQYVGVKNCKMCHSSKKSGAAFKIWEKSTHATAYETLASPESKKIAEEMGIEDPQKSEKCLPCHVTGYGKDDAMFKKTFSMENGVSCEACHGPGSEYNGMKVMKQLYAGEVEGAEYGLVEPTAELCKDCHNENSPTFKGFDYEKYVSQIAHPVPKD